MYNSNIIYHVFELNVPKKYSHEHSASIAFTLGKLERKFYFNELSHEQWASVCSDITFGNYLNQLGRSDSHIPDITREAYNEGLSLSKDKPDSDLVA